ncbi:AtpZ/AtpI family protein [Sphingomonas sp. ASV193]|uniref:AtpZ/AtpI family protein n=1 Tax=Sphingomonas sp. ASV193 TaxID=3144405 RepID=UPI0032E8653F
MADHDYDEQGASPPDSRLTSLDERLRRAEAVEKDRRPSPEGVTAVRSAGWQIAQNLVGMPLGGFLIGFGLDKLLGTVPWIALGLMFVGFAGAVMNVMRKQKA